MLRKQWICLRNKRYLIGDRLLNNCYSCRTTNSIIKLNYVYVEGKTSTHMKAKLGSIQTVAPDIMKSDSVSESLFSTFDSLITRVFQLLGLLICKKTERIYVAEALKDSYLQPLHKNRKKKTLSSCTLECNICRREKYFLCRLRRNLS